MSVPTKVDRYEIQEEIDRGGMATVFRAHDPRFQRTVAIKLLPQQMMHDPEFRKRFTREARTIAQLEHPAIVPVYDFGEDNGQPFLVMRLMEGGSLQQRLADGPLTVEESAIILQRLGSALDTAHSKGIVHRDLKPSNVLFDQYGDAYLADFGIAHVSASEANLTASGSLIGTPTYMSPEQVYGDKTLDGRSDIYALGVIMFQMLTGHIPYEADTPARVMMKHVMDPVPTISKDNPDLPAEMDAIIGKAMAKERDERYATAKELNADMTQATQRTTRPDLAAELAVLQSELEAPASETAVTELLPTATAESAEDPTSETATTELFSASPPEAEEDVIGIGTTSNDYYQVQSGSSGVPIWIWGVLLILLFLCIGGVIGSAYLFTTINTDELLAGLEPEEEDVDPTATVNLETEQEREDKIATRTALADATETAVPNTNTPRPTLTDEVVATSDIVALTRESVIATREAQAEEAPTAASTTVAIPNLFDNPILKADFGPEAGELEHETDDLIELTYTDNAPQNFIVAADIGNPFSAEKGAWDFGLVFRQAEINDELRLVVRSDGEWNLNNRVPGGDSFVQDGNIDGLLELGEEGGNQIILIALDDTGYFILNDEFVAQLDLSERPFAGDIALGTGFYPTSEQEGFATSYEAFSVWELEPEYGPESGEMEHILDDLIKIEDSGVNLSNFIAQTTFLNPFSATESDFDFGYGFRVDDDQYWLAVESTGDWALISRFDSNSDEDEVVNSGQIKNVNTGANESNTLTVITLGDTGYLLLNDQFIDTLDLSEITEAGDLQVITAYYFDHEIEGSSTAYEDFTIWQLP